jgi:hypothetical protein
MTKGELFEALEDMDDETEVMFAAQPAWPFEYTIADVAVVEIQRERKDPQDIIYLIEGRQFGYLPGVVANEIGW